MVEAAEPRMTLAEFLVWDDGTDMRYELIDGRPRAMAPAVPRHGAIQENVAVIIREKMGRDGPCHIMHQVGLILSVEGDDRYYVPDLVVSCAVISDTPYVEDPKLVVEIISPSTGRIDKVVKVPDYCTVESLEEIWLIDSRRPLVHVYQRRGGQWIGHIPLKLEQRFASSFLDADIEVADFYRGTGLDAPPDQPSSGQS